MREGMGEATCKHCGAHVTWMNLVELQELANLHAFGGCLDDR